MLDFAKSIMTGNARTIVGQVGSSKIYYDTEEDEYYTDCGGSIYDNPGFKTKNDAVNYIVKKNKTGNSNKAEIIEKKKKEGATLKVDNGQKLEFSDGSTYVKTSFSDDYREAHNYTGNTRTGNSYNWEERRGHQELYDPTFPFGGHVRGYVEKTKNGYVGAKTNGSIVIKQKEFATEAEAKKFVENKHTGNKKVGNAFSDSYEFYLSAGKNDLNTIKDKINKEGGWTAETKAMARKTSESLLKKAKEIVEIAHKQSSELEKLARDIQSI